MRPFTTTTPTKPGLYECRDTILGEHVFIVTLEQYGDKLRVVKIITPSGSPLTPLRDDYFVDEITDSEWREYLGD